MSWTPEHVIAALTPLGLQADAVDEVLLREREAGTLPERGFSLDDVARFVVAVLAESNTAEIDATPYTRLEMFSHDPELNDHAAEAFDKGLMDADLTGEIAGLIERGLTGQPAVMAEHWPFMVAVERVGVTVTPRGSCGWLAFSMWHGSVGSHCSFPATAFFGEPQIAPLITERSISASALHDVGSRLSDHETSRINGAAADRPSVH